MWHSVKVIAIEKEILSLKRNDVKKFNSIKFFNFAKQNINKYSLSVSGSDLLVNTMNVDNMVNDYNNC